MANSKIYMIFSVGLTPERLTNRCWKTLSKLVPDSLLNNRQQVLINLENLMGYGKLAKASASRIKLACLGAIF